MRILILLSLLLPQAARKPFELVDGDRVVFLGNTFFERDLQHNHLETALTARWPDRNVTFRNIGWDGDTVWAQARAGFGSAQDGYTRLTKLVGDLKPTVIFVAYGLNESFEGPGGVEPFAVQLDKMLDMLSRTQARIVLLSPLRHEDLGRPLPDPAGHNRSLKLYVEALAKIAARRGTDFVDLFGLQGAKDQPLTHNGIHLTDAGYLRAAEAIERALGLPARSPEIKTPAGVRTAPDDRALRVSGLSPGRYSLKADDAVVATATAEEWAAGVAVDPHAKLRAAIAAKNLLYFNYWRPQNDTYIFGFRRKEQGHLVPEFPTYLPLIEAREAEIAKLRVSVSRPYVLERAP